MRRALLLLVVLLPLNAIAELPDASASGWFQWTVDGGRNAMIVVRLKEGLPVEMRVSGMYCGPEPRAEVVDLGTISADENFAWFRRIAELDDADNEVRGTALFGLAQSESDAAFDYLEGILVAR